MNGRKIYGWLLFIFLSYTSHFSYGGPEIIQVYEYHEFPPMVVSKEKQIGLSFGFARYLTKKSKGRYVFKVNVFSMLKVQLLLEDAASGVVFFVSPIWFSDESREQYLWTQEVLTLRDEIVSLKSNPFEYQSDIGFKGKSIGGISGYTYPQLDELVNKKSAVRIDEKSDLLNLKKLASGSEVDAIIVNEGPLKFYSQILGIENDLYTSTTPSGVYPVRILLTKDLRNTYEFIEGVINNLSEDEAWYELKHLYLP